MKVVTATLNVTDEELFKALFAACVLDAQDKSGEKFEYDKSIEKGIKYKGIKRMGGKFSDYEVHIRKPLVNKNIHIVTQYVNATYEMDYKIEKLDGGKCKLTYSQLDSNNKNDKAGGFFKWQITNRFKKVEKVIIEGRNKPEEENTSKAE